MRSIEDLQIKFKEIFKTNSENVFFSPGRVNLIGEHTDYNGGHVFPCALSIGTYGVISKRTDSKVVMNSLNFENLGSIEFDLNNLVYEKAHDWVNYPKGVIKAFKDHKFKVTHGFNILVYGNIPNGAGLSSSASLELLISVILKETFNFNLSMLDMVKYSQEAENNFIGVNCGIMDQFAIGFGKKDSAILLDCNTLKYRYSKINMSGYKIVIGNTNKKRGLADSKYNERRYECEHALKEIQQIKNISSLGELTQNEFENLKCSISNPVYVKRAKHAVYENQRTLKAVNALERNDLIEFGHLMTESHNSLRDDYEVTGIELDTLVSLALEIPGVIGSRMTGAGFGGCTVSIVKENAVENFIGSITTDYTKKIGYSPSFYVVNISDGAKKLI